MRPVFAALAAAALMAGCAASEKAQVERAVQSLDGIEGLDQGDMNAVMLQASDPREAVEYFRKASIENPERVDLSRGLAVSLVRAKQPTQAVAVWRRVVESASGTDADRVSLADALVRAGDWSGAADALGALPEDHKTYRHAKLSAMIADSREDWSSADRHYARAAALTERPASVLNNWGYSKLSRGAPKEAERLFSEALTHDPTLFTAKNNLAMARGAQGKYDLPMVPVDQIEHAQLLHTLALVAIKRGDVAMGRGLLSDAVDTHPRHFDAAARALRALEPDVRG